MSSSSGSSTNTKTTRTSEVVSCSSWRSLGWKPLSYPLHALFQSNTSNLVKNPMGEGRWDIDDNDDDDNNIKLNPFFPLHETVIVAAIRELFLLDGVMDPRTLEVMLPPTLFVNRDRTKEEEEQEQEQEQEGGRVQQQQQQQETKRGDHLLNIVQAHATKTSPRLVVNLQTKKRKRNHLDMLQDLTRTQKHLVSMIISSNKVKRGVEKNDCHCGHDVFSSGEELVQLVMEDILLNHILHGHSHAVDQTFVGSSSSISSSNSSSSSSVMCKKKQHSLDEKENNRHNVIQSSFLDARTIGHHHCIDCPPPQNNSGDDYDHDNDDDNTNVVANIQRIRKVSDVSLDRDYNVAMNDDGTSPFASHVAVVVFNLLCSGMRMGDDLVVGNRNGSGDSFGLENVLGQFPEGLFLHGNTNTNAKASCNLYDCSQSSSGGRDYEELIKYLYQSQQLPDMLDLSIMLETYLRNMALSMVRRCFPIYVSDKALREFMGYKSSTASVDRVLIILADFLFDVSHAMFAWEKTEMDCFGNEDQDMLSTSNHMVASRDEAICRMLFDERALTKIGGFEPSSLLYHTVSIKRLGSKQESWEKFAKTQRAKRMFSHHDDHSAKIQAGIKRRAKRMKKNTTASYHTSISRCRSLSVVSNEDSRRYNSDEERLAGHSSPQQNSDCQSLSIMGLVASDLIPVTITREEGKSWGILLAKEGSMCVVMRAPDDSDLSVGDSIVSIRNEHFRSVTIPMSLHSFDTSSQEWFNNTVDMFKKSNTLHLEVRRVPKSTKGRDTHDG